jgi:hypothetical protein
MKKALISPDEQITYISGWTDSVPSKAIYTTIPNGERVADVSNADFPVSLPLYWVDCDDNIVADVWYYDSATGAFILTPEAVPAPQPIVEGAQTL